MIQSGLFATEEPKAAELEPVDATVRQPADAHERREGQHDIVPGWTTVPMGVLLEFKNGVNTDRSAYGSGIPFVNVLEPITHCSLTQSDIPGLVSLPQSSINIYRVRRGDLVFNRTSETAEELGLAAVYLDDAPVVFGGFVIRGRPLTSRITHDFSKYAFRTHFIRRQIVSRGQGVVRANIGQADLKTVLVMVPPLGEQAQIARTLGQVDLLIAELGRLTSKMENLKKASMQALLTGKLRLPGFVGEWNSVNLGRSSTLKARIGWQGLTTAEYLDDGEYNLVTGTDFSGGGVFWESCWCVDKLRFDQDRNIQLRANDILVTKDGTIGKIGFVSDLPRPATLNSGVFVIRPKDYQYAPLFLFYVLTSRIFSEFLDRLQAGSTINHLYQKDFVHFEFKAPEMEEQLQIASILKDIDDDLASLRARRNKMVDVRTGMMQQLLSGRIRLV